MFKMLIWIILLCLFIYLINKRLKIEKKETFEKRDN